MDTSLPSAIQKRRSKAPFRGLWLAAAGSSVGDGVLLAGLPLLADRLSNGDPLSVSMLLVAQRLPWLLIALAGGAAADRREARSLMVQADLVRFGVVGALALAVVVDRAVVPLLWLAAVALGGLDLLFWAAAQRMIPAVAEVEELERANGQLQVAQSTGEQVVGPAIGGFLFRIGGVLPLVADAASFLFSALMIRGMPKLPPEPEAADVSFRVAIRDGYRWFRHNERIRTVTLVVTGLAFGQTFVLSILVVFGTKVLGLGSAVGLFMAAIALGNVAGGLLAERVLRRFSQEKLIVFTALVATLAYGLSALTTSVVVTTVGLVIEGVTLQIANTGFAAMRQREVPRALLGRVATLTRSIIYGSISIGALLAGIVGRYGGGLATSIGAPAAGAGLRASFLCGALITLVTLVAGARPLRRSMRRHA